MHVPIPANIQNERNAGNTVVAPIRNAHTSVNDVTRMDTPLKNISAKLVENEFIEILYQRITKSADFHHPYPES